MYLQIQIPNSNTTFVNVKLFRKAYKEEAKPNSNTTFVNVKHAKIFYGFR